MFLSKMKDNDKLFTVHTRKPLKKVEEGLKDAADRHQFGILGVHDLKEKMESKGVDFPTECRVFEVCNPRQAKRVLMEDMIISTMLPCRISVWQEGDVVTLATVRPTELLTTFGDRKLLDVAREVEETMIAIMEEAAD